MTPKQHLAQVVRGMQEDLQGYAQLKALLEKQFEAALSHNTGQLPSIADEINVCVDALQKNRAARVEHVKALLGAGKPVSIAEVLRRLSGPVQVQVSAMWSQLEEKVRDCKALNLRNCRLIMEQDDLMRQILARDEGIYVPG